MAIKFYNTLTRDIQEFKPIKEGEVSLYTCGPTIYNYPHIGNLRTFLFEDLLHRWLLYRGYKVHHIMNLTDVDDKTIKNSIINNMSLKAYTDIYKQAFFDDLNALNVKPAELYPAATDHIQEMIKMVTELIKKGYAYETDDGVYFKVDAFEDYGKLSHLDRSKLKAGASGRIQNDEYSKEDISDFALWKKWTPEDKDVKWQAHFGEGRPGWHLECSVMSCHYLGKTIDIHAGGVDLIFPHHENEIAQSEATNGVPFVNYWLHSAHLIVNGEKMSKSKGNFYTLRDLQSKGYSNRAIRYILITNHYRKPLNFTMEGVQASESALKRIDDCILFVNTMVKVGNNDAILISTLQEKQVKFDNALDDDLNISEAISALFELIKAIYENPTAITPNFKQSFTTILQKWDEVLGFIFTQASNELSGDEQKLLENRKKAKADKDYTKADSIRQLLLDKGIEVRDTKEGQVWKRV